MNVLQWLSFSTKQLPAAEAGVQTLSGGNRGRQGGQPLERERGRAVLAEREHRTRHSGVLVEMTMES